MGEVTGISWCHHTFNPWWGCVEVSAECDLCYARELSERFTPGLWGLNSPRRLFGDAHWNEPLRWNKKAKKAGERRRVFCGSMCDILEDRRDLDAPRKRLWQLVEATDWLDWLLLSKRAGNFLRMVPSLRNAWLMTSVGYADTEWRIHELLRAAAPVHGISYEPALGPVVWPLVKMLRARSKPWLIIGGESGKKARPFELDWARNSISMCREFEVATFMKQLGSNPWDGGRPFPTKTFKGDDVQEWPQELQVQEFPVS